MTWYQRPLSKFGAQKTVFKNRVYDSKGEAGLAMELDLELRAGKLLKIEPQVTFDLFAKNGQKVCTHRPDFLVTLPDGTQEVREYKGFATEIWRLKLKLFEDNYPHIPYWVITPSGRKQFGKKKRNIRSRSASRSLKIPLHQRN